jgi:hypothetical protein
VVSGVDERALHPRLGFVLASLLDRSHLLHPDDIPVLVADAVAAIGANQGRAHLVDLEQRRLVAFRADGRGGPDLDVDGTVAGRAFRDGRVLRSGQGPGAEWWAPLLDGVDRVGVLRVEQGDADPEMLAATLPALATTLTHVIVTKAEYGDRVAVLRRRRELDLAAELRWSTLPPVTFRSLEVRIAAVLEPAYEIAGDTFDYAANGRTAHVAIVDAMGHGLQASRAADLAVAAYRNARRRGAALVDTVAAMDAAVRGEYADSIFVTGQLAELDVDRGALRWVNAGHPRPLRLRHGRAQPLTGDPYLPIGLGDVTTEAVLTSLEPGDAVLFFTDGIVDARSRSGERFGERRLADRLATCAAGGLSVAETARRLSLEVAEHRRADPDDDATLLLVVWDGPAR